MVGNRGFKLPDDVMRVGPRLVFFWLHLSFYYHITLTIQLISFWDFISLFR